MDKNHSQKAKAFKKQLEQMQAFKKQEMCPVIAGVTKKGGVGKTMISCAIGAVTSYAGLRVLIIETCEQMNTVNLMAVDRSIKDVDHLSFGDLIRDPGLSLSKLIIKSKIPFLYILPAAAGMNDYFTKNHDSFEEGYKAVQTAMNELRKIFDLIIIDSPPSDSRLPITAIAACTHYFFIADSDNNAIDGIRQIQKTLGSVTPKNNPNIKPLGILMNDKMKNTAFCEMLISMGGVSPFNYMNFMIPQSKKPITFAVTVGDGHWLKNAFEGQKINTPIESALYDFTYFLMTKTGLIEESFQ